MAVLNTYPVGTAGVPWGSDETAAWLARQSIKRSYRKDVLEKIPLLKEHFNVEQYGALSHDEDRYPLFAFPSKKWDKSNETVLVTGGVHGYETSGVQGAIRFLDILDPALTDRLNLIVVPCVSPWGYETINRWNPNAVDPNRSFTHGSTAEEAAFLMSYVTSLDCTITAHIDLHETTDTDRSEFGPALAARDGLELDDCNIPDGFYLVGDVNRPVPEFQKAIIQSVGKVTHIAEPDNSGHIIGEKVEQPGVINYAIKTRGLCTGFSDAEFSTTTEVYPDSPNVDDQICIAAQVAVVTSALNYILTRLGN